VDVPEIECSSGHWLTETTGGEKQQPTTNSAAAAMAMDQTLIKTINKLQDSFSSVMSACYYDRANLTKVT
jgi:hypothetical protein